MAVTAAVAVEIRNILEQRLVTPSSARSVI